MVFKRAICAMQVMQGWLSSEGSPSRSEEFTIGCAGRRELSVNHHVCSNRVDQCRTTRRCIVGRRATQGCVEVCQSTGRLPPGRKQEDVYTPSFGGTPTRLSRLGTVAGRRLVRRLVGTGVARTQLGGNCRIGKSNAMVLCNGGVVGWS